jgi:hypothetical protein
MATQLFQFVCNARLHRPPSSHPLKDTRKGAKLVEVEVEDPQSDIQIPFNTHFRFIVELVEPFRLADIARVTK